MKTETGDPASGPVRRTATRSRWLLGTAGFVVLGVLAAGLMWRSTGRPLPPSPLPPAPRLVLLYATCSLNKSYLQPYNPSVTYTPNLERFGRLGRVFARQQTEEGQSGIAYASLFTGTQAMFHGVYAHPAELASSLYTLAEAYRDQGYTTYFWSLHSMASPSLNYNQGVANERTFSEMLVGADPKFLAVLKTLDTHPEARAYVQANHTVTHNAYGIDRVATFCAHYPEECRDISMPEIERAYRVFVKEGINFSYDFKATIARLHYSPEEVRTFIAILDVIYKSRVNYLDELFGGVVDAIAKAGLLDQSLIVFTSDHGELLYRDNAPFEWTHGLMLAPEDLGVPLIIHAPGVAPGVYSHVTRSIDVYPTMAGLSRFQPTDRRIMGVDLSPTLQQGIPEPDLLAYSHTSLIPQPFLKDSLTLPVFHRLFPAVDVEGLWVAVRDGDMVYKLTRENGHEVPPKVFDWAADPEERRDLYDAANPHHIEMIAKLRRYKDELVRAYDNSATHMNPLPDAEQRARLRSLGYIR